MPGIMQYNFKTLLAQLDIFIKSNSIETKEAILLKYKLTRSKDKDSILPILTLLNPPGLLQGKGSIDRLNCIMENDYKSYLAQAILLLNNNGLFSGGLAQSNLDMILAHPETSQMAQAIESLDATQSLSQNNLDIIKIVEKPTSKNVVKLLAYHSIFSQHLPQSAIAEIALSYLMPEEATHRNMHQFASMIGLFGGKNSISDIQSAEPQQVGPVSPNTCGRVKIL
jgi:hypothetical protein